MTKDSPFGTLDSIESFWRDAAELSREYDEIWTEQQVNRYEWSESIDRRQQAFCQKAQSWSDKARIFIATMRDVRK